jgi:hypothetical protein
VTSVFITGAHVAPVQLAPLHDEKSVPELGVAVSVTVAPSANEPVHFVPEHVRPAGFEVIEPAPPPVMFTVSVCFVGVVDPLDELLELLVLPLSPLVGSS